MNITQMLQKVDLVKQNNCIHKIVQHNRILICFALIILFLNISQSHALRAQHIAHFCIFDIFLKNLKTVFGLRSIDKLFATKNYIFCLIYKKIQLQVLYNILSCRLVLFKTHYFSTMQIKLHLQHRRRIAIPINRSQSISCLIHIPSKLPARLPTQWLSLCC